MIAYKATSKDIASVLGNGKKECCTFELGRTYREEESKTARNGFHCCENPFECLSYYRMDGENRFFIVEAAGDIDEDSQERIACTEITFKEEMSMARFAYEGMKYIVEHPDREKWKQDYRNVIVAEDRAKLEEKGIAIARGSKPMVKGPKGSILGMIVEDETGIVCCKIMNSLDEKWYRLTREREVEEVEA